MAGAVVRGAILHLPSSVLGSRFWLFVLCSGTPALPDLKQRIYEMTTHSVESVPEALQQSAQRAFDFAQAQVRRLITNHPDYFPLFTLNGKWYHQSEAWTNWCEGFLGGMLWIFARRTGDAWWRERAEHYARLIEH